ncbi:MAG: hypothetical protein KJO82_11480 [Gammaproteobacteria bacterium]|nr:hypothetical protein [Gammaproteobacteria bacterium]
MTSLTAIFGNASDQSADNEKESEKLLNLYWNRAELKKEFASLREEQFRLKDIIKEKEGAAARLQQKLDHLENLLLDPEWIYNIVTYYQLRGLNLRCQGKLAKFAEQLKQQREQRQHSQLLADWNAGRASEAADVQRQIGEQRMRLQTLEDQLQAERQRLISMNGLLRFFRRRSVTRMLDRLAADIDVAHANERELLLAFDEIEKREPPDTQGLDIRSKRSINFMILAFAQQLYLHFHDFDLASLAKEAGEKSIGAINYGGKASCDEILGRIAKRVEALDSAADFANELKQRARLIAEKARFRLESDAVPVSATVATVYDVRSNGTVSEEDGNLLGENYWNLSQVLSR